MGYTLLCLALSEWLSECESVCVPVDDDLGPVAAEELGHVQTIENNVARYHVTSHQDPSQQLDSVSSPKPP